MNLTKDILEVINRHGFLGVVVIGTPGIGKSVYAQLIGKELALELGLAKTEYEGWDWAREQIVHGTEQLAKALKDHNRHNRRRLIIWDDAGEGGGSFAFSRGFKHMDALKNVLELIRTSCCCLIMTTIAYEGLAKFIRNYNYWKIAINKRHTNKK